MLLLQSKDIYEDVIEFNPESRDVNFKKRSESAGLEEAFINGTFAYVGEKLLMLYREGGTLRFCVDGAEVVLDEGVVSELEVEGERGVFVINRGGDELLKFEYRLTELEESIPGDMTPFVDSEDFDFCLFVHKVLGNDERRDGIYKE